MGGSLTYGHGLPEGGSPWPLLVEAGLRKVFPKAKVTVVNGAIPATGTDYFQACYQHHVPAGSDVFVLEGAVNDLIMWVGRVLRPGQTACGVQADATPAKTKAKAAVWPSTRQSTPNT